MTEKADQSIQSIEQTTTQLRLVAAAYLQEGVSPGVMCGSLIRLAHEIMVAQDMSPMQISNQLNWLCDEVREEAYTATN